MEFVKASNQPDLDPFQSPTQALLGIQESGLHVPNIIITEQVRKLEDGDYWSYLAPLVGDVKTPKITSVRTLGEL